MEAPPMDCAANCVAREGALAASSPLCATKRSWLMRITPLVPNAWFSCCASTAGLFAVFMKARTNRPKSSFVACGRKWMLARPAACRSWAKLRSAAAVPTGTPSSKSWPAATPRSNPELLSAGWAAQSSFHAISRCSAVRVWSQP